MTDRNGMIVALLLAASIALASVPAATAQEGDNSMEMTITVSGDAEIETTEVVWETGTQTYEMMNLTADNAGYDSVAEWFAEESMVGEDTAFEDYGAADDRELEDGYAIEITFTEFNESGFEDLELTAEDGTVSFETADLDDPAEDDMFSEITYVVEMPGEITDSNAHEVDGNVATWHLHEEAESSITVESDASDDESDDGLPGFGAGAAAVGALAAVALLGRRAD